MTEELIYISVTLRSKYLGGLQPLKENAVVPTNGKLAEHNINRIVSPERFLQH